MEIYLVDGTYELFRYFFAVPSHRNSEGLEVGALRAAVRGLLRFIDEGATHLGVATDHVIESFRNEMWPTYKSSAGVDPSLLVQFKLYEECLRALGVTLWPMVDFEADDALATTADALSRQVAPGDQIRIASLDKDFSQCVVGDQVVLYDRRKDEVTDASGVVTKWGVGPESIADYLGLVGDSADGFPGIQGWGAKSAARVLARYQHIEEIPKQSSEWEGTDISPGRAVTLATNLAENYAGALLFKDIATVRTDVPEAVDVRVPDLAWHGPDQSLRLMADRIDAPELYDSAQRIAEEVGDGVVLRHPEGAQRP